MQQFYEITQSKVGNFANCINVTLDEKGHLLKDFIFYGMNKSLRDSVHYL